jgi:hypothetical protein
MKKRKFSNAAPFDRIAKLQKKRKTMKRVHKSIMHPASFYHIRNRQ